MAVTEVERAELVEDLAGVVSPKSVETLMKCVLPEGRDHLATKDDLGVLKKDLEVLEHALRADFAELRAYVDASLAQLRTEFAELRADFADLKAHNEAMHGKQTRLLMTSLAGFAISTWTPMLVYLAV